MAFVISKVTGNAVDLAKAYSLGIVRDGAVVAVDASLPDGQHQILFIGSESECKAYINVVAARENAGVAR